MREILGVHDAPESMFTFSRIRTGNNVKKLLLIWDVFTALLHWLKLSWPWQNSQRSGMTNTQRLACHGAITGNAWVCSSTIHRKSEKSYTPQMQSNPWMPVCENHQNQKVVPNWRLSDENTVSGTSSDIEKVDNANKRLESSNESVYDYVQWSCITMTNRHLHRKSYSFEVD